MKPAPSPPTTPSTTLSAPMTRIDCQTACWTPFSSPAPLRFEMIAAAAVETPKLMMVPRAAT